MKTIHVTASTSYQVKIGAGLLDHLGQEISQVCKANTVCVISDSAVWPLYGRKAKQSLEAAGFRALHYVFPEGESNKNGQVFLSILNFLAENHITRSDCIVALGGGVTGDMAGFVAATYLRGIPFVQVPTTLLAAVDSSVGGKTAIDLDAGKNLAGAFYQPKLVLCDLDTLRTLPESIFRDGCAEVIKYGVLYDPELFSHLWEKGVNFDREMVIARCVQWKRDVVAVDEFDTGDRQKLNLGHTIGHGIEARSDFLISHGQAVAIGMAVISRSAEKMGLLSPADRDAILQTICKFGLPISTNYSSEELFEAALSDKKRSGGTVTLVIPESIGSCILRPTPVEELKSLIEAGL